MKLIGRLNILTIKYEEILSQINMYKTSKQKSKDTRINFIIQILIIVFAAVILGTLSVAASYIWNGFVTSVQTTNVSTVQNHSPPTSLNQ